MVNTGLPPSTARGRRAEAAFREATRRVLARDGFLHAHVADIAGEATRLAGRSSAWFHDGSHAATVVGEHLRRALRAAGPAPRDLCACWWDACAAAPQAVRALVQLGGPVWEEVRAEVRGRIDAWVGDPLLADALTCALVATTLRWTGADRGPSRDGAVAVLARILSPSG